ncbi:MAG: Stk1 family PASTA domain-containing Ser/Thr kinase [Vulcanimicrobiaceae bacterium]
MKETALLAGRYRIDDLLGEGGTGSVRRAQDTLLGRTVAIKMLAPTYARDASFVERFYAEARLAARIVDPHVVAIFDIVSDDATHAIVMECIDGPSLAGVLARGGHLDEARTIDYARQILAALRAAHAQNIVHRDLKPANVLVAPSGALKVTDFGLARAVGPDDRTIVVPGALVGSVHYAAPEQIQGLPVGPAADLYSLGVMLYEFRFGSVPFRGDSAIEVALAHVHVPGPSFAALVERMTPGLARIVERLLRKDPRERYASAADLDAALGALAVASPGGAYGTDEPTLVGDAPIFVAPQPRPKRTAPSLPQSEGRARRIALAILGVIVAAAASCRAASARAVAVLGDRFRRLPATLAAVRSTGVPQAAPGRGSWRRLAVIVAVAGILALAVGALRARPPSIVLADVRGSSGARAQAVLSHAGLQVVAERHASRTVRAGLVIAERPAPGTVLHRGDRVTVRVSSGLPTVAVPNLVGLPFGDAVRRMAPLRLHVRYAATFASAPANAVVEQIPPATTVLREGANEIVVISTGADPRVRVTGGGGGGGGDGGD